MKPYQTAAVAIYVAIPVLLFVVAWRYPALLVSLDEERGANVIELPPVQIREPPAELNLTGCEPLAVYEIPTRPGFVGVHLACPDSTSWRIDAGRGAR